MASKRVLDVFKYYINRKGGFDECLANMTLTSANDKKIEMEFTVTEAMINPANTLHGGLTATVADLVSSLGLIAADRNPGVSINLSMNYLKGAKVGEDIIVESEIVKAGKSVAYLDIKLTKKNSGDIVATGSHVKHIGLP